MDHLHDTNKIEGFEMVQTSYQRGNMLEDKKEKRKRKRHTGGV
jgi:hypothetical protein